MVQRQRATPHPKERHPLNNRCRGDARQQESVASEPPIRASRRPCHYWEDPANLEQEIRAFIEAHGADPSMPTAHDLDAAGRADLAGAIASHGGYGAVAARLGLRSRYRPRGYWADMAHVDAEVRAIWRELGQPAQLPGMSQLAALGPPGLPGAIYRHGGARAVAQRLGLRPWRTPTRTWAGDLPALARELRTFLRVQADPTRFPALATFRQAGRGDLVTAIRATGGGRAWAARLRVRPQQMPVRYWQSPAGLQALETALRAQIVADPAGHRDLPTIPQLLAAGHPDLVRDVRATGGHRAWRVRLGLISPRHPPGYWHTPETLAAITADLRAFLATQPPPVTIPTPAQLRAAGQAALLAALVQTGGRRAWAARLGLPLRRNSRRLPARHNCPWTPDEDARLQAHWGVWSDAHLARVLHRPISGLADHARTLGLTRETNALRLPTVAAILGIRPSVVWHWCRQGLLAGLAPDRECHRWRIDPAELERFIRQHPERVRPAQMDREGYPYYYNLAKRNQTTSQGHKVKRLWTARENAYLANHYRCRTAAQLSAYLDRPPRAIYMQLWRLRRAGRLLPYKPGHGGGVPRRPWTPDEDAYLLAQAAQIGTPTNPLEGAPPTLAEIAAALDRPVSGVRAHLQRLRAAEHSPEEGAAAVPSSCPASGESEINP